MESVFFALAMISFALEATLLLRASHAGFLSEFPIFYSYVFVVLVTSSVDYLIYFLFPKYYASAYWFCFVVWLVAEFAVLLQASDHIFKPYHPIRRLGRLLTSCICLTFLFVFIIPSLMQHRSSSMAMLDLVKMTSLTKSVLIVVLLGAARLYRLPLGKNISGMLLGFAIYLSVFIAIYSLAEIHGRERYGEVLQILDPLSFVIGLAIWNVALWRYEPVLQGGRELERCAENISEPLTNRLGKYKSELTRLFRR